MKKLTVSLASLAALTIVAVSAYASESGYRTLSDFQVRSNGDYMVWPEGSNWDNGEVCDQSNKAVFVLIPNNENQNKTIYATIALAFATGKEVSFTFTGCVDISGTTFPIVKAARIRQ